MRLSDYRQQELKPGLTRQLMLGSLFLYLTGCNITGDNNPIPVSAYPLEFSTDPEVSDSGTPTKKSITIRTDIPIM
jgi:hypothetical protein